MDIEQLREYLINKSGSSENLPFDDTTLVFKVGGKMFALFDIDQKPIRCNLKCEPERAIELREKYKSILPGWHMNKKHWNTVVFEEDIDNDLIMELIDLSYDLVFQKLTKKQKDDINTQLPPL